MMGAIMYFSESAAKAPILFGGVRARRLTEDQVQRNPENGQDGAGGREGEGGATRKVATAPERPHQEEERAEHRQPVGWPAGPGQLRGQDAAETGQVHDADQREGQWVPGTGESRHPSPAAIGPPPITRSPS